MNIIRIKSDKEKTLDYITEFRKYVKKNKIDNLMIVCKDKYNKEMATGYCNLDMGQKMEMLGHVQADIIDQMIRENIDRYIEIAEV